MNKKYNGKDIFSYIIPDGVNIIKKSGDNISFQIENGKFIKGNLDKSSLSLSKNSIIHIIWDKYGPDRTSKFIDDAQKLVLNYTLTYGTTIGFKDVVTSKTFNEQIGQIINNKILESKYNITQFENDTIQLPLDIIENYLSKELNALSTDFGQLISKELSNDNFFNVAARSGAKGNIYTYNKGTGIGDLFKTIPKNQYDVRTTNDIVSLGSLTQSHPFHNFNEIEKTQQNLLQAHEINNLSQ